MATHDNRFVVSLVGSAGAPHSGNGCEGDPHTGKIIVPNAVCSPNEAAKWAKALAGTW